MMQRIPIIPTIIVLCAVATMVALGFWQLGRADEKAALIAAYEAALANDDVIDWPLPDDYQMALYRRAKVECLDVKGFDAIGGKSRSGQTGWVHVARCQHDGAGVADVTLGWSLSTQPPAWHSGTVTGRIAPYGDAIRLIPDDALAGLEPVASPDPKELPNNHIAYVGQWFFFALTALVIYGFALRSRAAKLG